MTYGIKRILDIRGGSGNAAGTLNFPASTAPELDLSGRHLGIGMRNPFSTCLADQISAKQISIVRNLAQLNGVSASEVTDDIFDCDFTELSKSAATQLIEYLETRLLRSKSQIRLAG